VSVPCACRACHILVTDSLHCEAGRRRVPCQQATEEQQTQGVAIQPAFILLHRICFAIPFLFYITNFAVHTGKSLAFSVQLTTSPWRCLLSTQSPRALLFTLLISTDTQLRFSMLLSASSVMNDDDITLSQWRAHVFGQMPNVPESFFLGPPVHVFGQISKIPQSFFLRLPETLKGCWSVYGFHMGRSRIMYLPNRVTLLGLNLPEAWTDNSYSKMSPELLKDLGFQQLDVNFGKIWEYYLGAQSVAAGDFQMALHTRGAMFGFQVDVVQETWKEPYRHGNMCNVSGLRIIVTLQSVELFNEKACGYGIPEALLRAHLAVDAAIKTHRELVKPLYPRQWFKLAEDLSTLVVVQPSLDMVYSSDYAVKEQQVLYTKAREAILHIAACGGRLAFDLEDDPISLATLGVVDTSNNYIVVIEEEPYPLLRLVCQSKCTLLVYSATESKWMAKQQIPMEAVEFVDLQQNYLRNDANLQPGHRYDEDIHEIVPTRDRRLRPIDQALAIYRTRSDPLYLKVACQDSFFKPQGLSSPTIWKQRPLDKKHVSYAASDVMALLIMDSP
jgi:hypothetical protein